MGAALDNSYNSAFEKYNENGNILALGGTLLKLVLSQFSGRCNFCGTVTLNITKSFYFTIQTSQKWYATFLYLMEMRGNLTRIAEVWCAGRIFLGVSVINDNSNIELPFNFTMSP